MTYHDLQIIDETNHYIVVVKPVGVLSQKDITNDEDMLTLIKAYLVDKYQKKGDAYLGLVHRLDRMTSGLMVFAKTSKGASRLSEEIRNHTFIKEYITLVEGKICDNGSLVDYLNFDEKKLKAYIDNKNGKVARLSYEVLAYDGDNTVLRIRLETGRHHQIRVQMANFHHPLVGDSLYGSQVTKNIKLHAYKLAFLDPVTKELKEYINYPTWYERK
ncbi:MAG: RNA pseudouridine synthase [Bacilli bacterium]|nr:RNA pseudouridine synthase [Bacilli bacterium]